MSRKEKATLLLEQSLGEVFFLLWLFRNIASAFCMTGIAMSVDDLRDTHETIFFAEVFVLAIG